MPPIPVSLRRLVVALLLLQNVVCLGQSSSDGQKFRNDDFGWNIIIPRGFEKVPDTLWARMQNKGLSAIESTYDAKVDNQAKTIFVFSSDQFNYIESNYQPFDPVRDGNYLEGFKNVNDVLYGTLKANMPKASLDSSYSRELVGGKEFNVFNVAAQLNPQVTLHLLMYSRLFGGKEFTVNIMYMDAARGKDLLEAWRGSSFDK